MNGKKENLKELLNKFYAEAEAAKAEEDILRGEQIISDNPSPQPDEKLISEIKSRISVELAKQDRRGVRTYLRTALAAAAVILIVSGLIVMYNHKTVKPAGSPIISQVGIENSDFTADDAELAVLAADIEALEDEILALRLGENGTEWMNADEIEIELLEINEDFWKG